MDDGAGPEEEAGLEEGVRHDVEHPGGIGPDATGQEHVPELRDCRVREDLLDVVLRQADHRREDGRHAPDHRDDERRLRGQAEEDVATRHHVDAGRDHRRGMDQGGDGRGPRHRVGQPDVERHLRALAHRSDEEAQADQAERRGVPARVGRRGGEDLVEVERVEEREEPEHPEQEAEVADAVDDEGLPAGVGGVLAVVVVTDQQVGAEAHALPADEEQEEVLRENEHQHREHEEVQVREVARVTRLRLVVAHVADRVHVDQEPDERHEGDHHGRKRIQPQGQVGGEAARGNPTGDPLHPRGVVSEEERDQASVRRCGRETHRSHSGHGDEALAEALAEQTAREETRERQGRDEPEGDRAHLTTSGG